MKAIILHSGGLDSTVNLALAIAKGRSPLALSFDYGQKHLIELKAAERIAHYYEVPHIVLKIDTSHLKNCALVSGETVKDRSMDDIASDQLSPNFVPGRNTLFLSHALSLAEVENAHEIYFGGNAADHAFPDCSPEFVKAMQTLMHTASPHHRVELMTPLLYMSKVEIVAEANRLNVPIEMTHSCYDPVDGEACLRCDACILRRTTLRKNPL